MLSCGSRIFAGRLPHWSAGIAFILLQGLSGTAWPASNQWVWMKGSQTISQNGIYGTVGISAETNVPGSRRNSVSWTDSSGDLWLFGGHGRGATGSNSYLNDLWKYDSTVNQWVWVKGSDGVDQRGTYGTQGVAAAENMPGARNYSVSWKDDSGNLWLFGGYGFAAAGGFGAFDNLNDLWRFDPLTSQWAWMKGSDGLNQSGNYGTQGVAADANTPGARSNSISWTDTNGKLWLFGGYMDGPKNDLWKFDPLTNQWVWMKGGSGINQNGIYGIKGIGGEANAPGARFNSVSWTDSSGKLWLFGGSGFASTGSSYADLNDLWRYDPLANQWTWMMGSDGVNQNGIYGIQGIPAGANVPGARDSSISWTDKGGNLWLFGGYGFSASGDGDFLNDLWKYNPPANQWTWMMGSDGVNQTGVYGIPEIPAQANTPGARINPVAWTDDAGHLWLFGGFGNDALGDIGYLNDLWELIKLAQANNDWMMFE